MRNVTIAVVSALTALWAIAPVRGANLLVNGGFESPVVPVGGFKVFGVGADVGGWTVTGVGQVGPVSTTFTQFGLSFPAQEAEQWLDLTGLSSNSATGVIQTIATTPGNSYDLTFWVGNMVNPGGIFGTTSTVNVVIDGTPVAARTNSGGGTTQTWEKFVVPFTANASSTTIALINGDPASDNSNGLDNVSVEPAGAPAVPLPPALWTGLTVLRGLLLTHERGRAARREGGFVHDAG